MDAILEWTEGGVQAKRYTMRKRYYVEHMQRLDIRNYDLLMLRSQIRFLLYTIMSDVSPLVTFPFHSQKIAQTTSKVAHSAEELPSNKRHIALVDCWC